MYLHPEFWQSQRVPETRGYQRAPECGIQSVAEEIKAELRGRLATPVTAAAQPATDIDVAGIGCLFKESFLDGPVPAVLPLCSRWRMGIDSAGQREKESCDGEKQRAKKTRPRARAEDETGARLGEGRRTKGEDEGPCKNKNKRNRDLEREWAGSVQRVPPIDRRGG